MRDIRELATLPLFAGCTPAEISEIIQALGGDCRRYPAGAVVLHEGHPADYAIMVVSGAIHVLESEGDSSERCYVRRLERAQLFGGTFLSMKPAFVPAMLVADEDSVVLRLSVSRIRAHYLAGDFRHFYMNFFDAVSEAGYYAWRKLMILSLRKVTDRVLLRLKWFLADRGLTSAPLPLNRTRLAAYLGVSRMALYRALEELEAKGILRINGRQVTILKRLSVLPDAPLPRHAERRGGHP